MLDRSIHAAYVLGMNTFAAGDRVQIDAGNKVLHGTVQQVRKLVQVHWDEYGFANWEKPSSLDREV